MAWLPIVLEVAKVVVPLVVGALGMHAHHKRKGKKAQKEEAS